MKPHLTYAHVDLKALTYNLDILKQQVKGCNIIAVVKGSAYGHGSVFISRHLIKNGVGVLGVAFVEEAIELREAGINAPVLVFFDSYNNLDAIFRHGLTPTVFSIERAKMLSREAVKRDKTIAIHIKVDTGMGRLGFRLDDAVKSIKEIADMKGLVLEGLMSHFSEADLSTKDYAIAQLNAFLGLKASLEKYGIRFRYSHMANSAAVLGFKDALMDTVRPGLMLYGYDPAGNDDTVLMPILSLHSKVLSLKKVPPSTPISYGRTFITKRDSVIAAIPIGYADGYNRLLSNKGWVIIRGKRAPVVGRICMDITMVDVTEIPGVEEGDEVVIIGSQGRERITANDIACLTGTIPYEVLTSIGPRVPRVYTA